MKKLFIVGTIVCAAVSANASYLYWQVDSGDTGMSEVQSWAAASTKNWDTATFYLRDSSGATVAQSTLANLDINEDNYQGRTGVTSINLGNIGTGSGYTYYIELVNTSSSTQIGWQKGTYADLAGQATTYTDELPIDSIPQASVWHGGTYKATPEPTSAMLMLLGVAGLALRRKQRKLA